MNTLKNLKNISTALINLGLDFSKTNKSYFIGSLQITVSEEYDSVLFLNNGKDFETSSISLKEAKELIKEFI
tara:strand:+ start:152 stop:367 length:216 start_codon:yes stop_codon:yes gene_type:complete